MAAMPAPACLALTVSDIPALRDDHDLRHVALRGRQRLGSGCRTLRAIHETDGGGGEGDGEDLGHGRLPWVDGAHCRDRAGGARAPCDEAQRETLKCSWSG